MKLKQNGKRTVRRLAVLADLDRKRCTHDYLYTEFSKNFGCAFGESIVDVYCIDCYTLVYEERVRDNEIRYDLDPTKRRVINAAHNRMAFEGTK